MSQRECVGRVIARCDETESRVASVHECNGVKSVQDLTKQDAADTDVEKQDTERHRRRETRHRETQTQRNKTQTDGQTNIHRTSNSKKAPKHRKILVQFSANLSGKHSVCRRITWWKLRVST